MNFRRSSKTNALPIAALALCTWLVPSTASAGVDVYTPIDVGDFVPNSADLDPAFRAAASSTAGALGLPITHLSFEFESDGTPLPPEQSIYSGTIFSDDVTFRSPDADSSSPERVPENINLLGGSGHRIGSIPGFSGALEVDFAAASGAVNLVGLGIVDLDPGATIQIFDANDAALATYTLPADVPRFAFVGFEATEGDQIGRLLIEQSEPKQSYALQDIEFVPEPCAGLLQFAALATLVGLSRTRRRTIAP